VLLAAAELTAPEVLDSGIESERTFFLMTQFFREEQEGNVLLFVQYCGHFNNDLIIFTCASSKLIAPIQGSECRTKEVSKPAVPSWTDATMPMVVEGFLNGC
jgi:hypothetical protein